MTSLFREAATDAGAAAVAERQREVGVDAAAPVPPLRDEVIGALEVLRKAAAHLRQQLTKLTFNVKLNMGCLSQVDSSSQIVEQ